MIQTIEYTIGHDEIAQTVTDYDSSSGLPPQVSRLVFGHDGHGSVRVVFDMAAAIAQVFAFEAYGQMLAIHNGSAQFVSNSASDALTSVLYSGEPFDAKIAQQYLRARWYDPATGRFNRLDPFSGNMTDPQSLHKYLYVHGDPVMGVDPSGLFSLAGLAGRMAMGGALSGALLGGIADGWRGAVRGAFVGAITGALAAVLAVYGGLGISYGAALVGLSLGPTASITSVMWVMGIIGAGVSVREFAVAETGREKVAALVGLFLSVMSPKAIQRLPGFRPGTGSGKSLLGIMTGRYSAFKGKVGEWFQIWAMKRQGFTLVARHVRVRTPRTSSKGTEIDAIFRGRDGKLYGRESKFGSGARLSQAQRNGYPDAAEGKIEKIVRAKVVDGEALDLDELQRGLPIVAEWFGPYWQILRSVSF